MHLDFSRSVYKGKVYISYRLARSVREGSKIRKEVLFPLGTLNPLQVKQIQLILHTLKRPDDVLVALQQIVPTRAVSYLDVAVANFFWDDWGLDLAFPESTESDLSSSLIARILTINRCVDPCSHYRIPKWVSRTALPNMLQFDTERLNDDKIYYELDKIDQNKPQIEKYILEVTKNRNPKSYHFVNYDLSTAYFVGIKCNLSRFGKGKDNQPYMRQVVLAILVNSDGYPFKWDVFPGNKAEVLTLEENIIACQELGVDSVTMVFDRGLVSKKNLAILLEKGVKFISALDKPQISKVEGIDLQPFAKLPEKNAEAYLKSLPHFKSFDGTVFYQDLGVKGGLRYVLSVNVNLLREERKLRRQKFRQFDKFLNNFNKELKNAKRDRDIGSTRRKVEDQLKKLKIARFFEEPFLKPVTVKRTLANGEKKPVSSFQVELKKKPEAIDEAKLLDGLCVFISNHTEKSGRGYAMTAVKIIQAYRDKTEIEDAFKNMKSILKLRPFFVNTEAHVRAVFTICVLSYHINKTLALKRKEIEGKDYLNSPELYDPFTDCKMVTLKDPESGAYRNKVIPPSRETKNLLRRLSLAGLLQEQM
jgi:transposase